GVQLAICRSIAQWREQLAVEQDLTRRKIMADDLVLKLAMTTDATQLIATDKHIARFGADEQKKLAQAIQAGLNTPESAWPVVSRQRPSAEEKAQLKRLQSVVQNQADRLNIHQSVLCSKKELEKLMQGSRHGKLLTGWRLGCIGQRLLAEVK
ncbi:MAG: hypothetical protein OEM07_03890, partial [Gammaproteobacteria bacterium]|nr:hypothetical protein [Gammaproteobacteria bacterium]